VSASSLESYEPVRQPVIVVDDEFAAVSEGRIRIRIGVVIFIAMLVIDAVKY